jgi:hypothetical protein
MKNKYAIIKQTSKYYVVMHFTAGGIFSNFDFMYVVRNKEGGTEHTSIIEAQETVNRMLDIDRKKQEDDNIKMRLYNLIKTGEVIATYES